VFIRLFLEIVLGILLVVYVSRHPEGALNALLIIVPFSIFILAGLFRIGVPHAIVRPLGQWKELLIVGIIVASARRFRASGRRPDAVDWVAIAFVAIGSAYLIVPKLFVGTAVGSQLTLTQRELGWRGDVLYVLLFLAFRHLLLPGETVERIMRRVLVAGSVCAGIGVFEFFFSNLWNKIAVTWFAVPRYLNVVLGIQPSATFNLYNVNHVGHIAGHSYVRVGSVFLDFLGIAFYFAICLGIAAELIARGRARPWVYLSIPLLGTALLMTQTRAGILAGGVALLVALRPQIGRLTEARIRFGIVLGAVAIVIFPIVLLTHVGARFTGDSASNKSHQNSYRNGISIVEHAPLGRGLATAAGPGQQISFTDKTGKSANYVTTESQYLQVGVQLGVLAMADYILLFFLVVRLLHQDHRGADQRGRFASPSAMRNGVIALALGGLVLQPFTTFAVAWTLWGLAGLAAGVVDRGRSETSEYAYAQVGM
jgi:hypothetical protein